ncbi:MAG TPA: 30S ribosomal protein S7 [Candidatus Faecimonas gallistercoris]|nr:30S ribosomal protein S7 [Candidatus Faecimonas gallistercoris]
MRKRRATKRDILPDPIYKSKVVAKLINTIMLDGKKGIAQTIVYDAFDKVKDKTGKDALEVFESAMENITPQLEVKSRRVGGSNYQVPIEVSPARGQALALRWLTKCSRERGGKGMADNLANEIVDASNGTGAAVKKREDTHRMAEANKAFAHYRW